MKRWLNLDDDITEDDDLVSELIVAAREACESYTKKSLIDSHWILSLSTFPCDGRIVIPIAPVIGIVGVSYLGNDGERVELDTSEYLTVLDEPARIDQNPSGWFWPSVAWQAGAVQIEIRAGYASAGSPEDATNVPRGLKTGIKMLAAHLYEHREAVSTDHRNGPSEIPLGMEYLFDPYRTIYQ